MVCDDVIAFPPYRKARFARYVGIDYSGAETVEAYLPGLRAYTATPTAMPAEVKPPYSSSRYWTRKALAHWLEDFLGRNEPVIVGIDHGFSFPLKYFQKYRLARDWERFLEDFQAHWPTREKNTYVDFIRENVVGNGAARKGNSRWRRLTDVRAGSKSVFHFDVPGSVAKATFCGLPWLLHLRRQLRERLHFWPFDGWEIPPGKSVVTEIYPSLWKADYPLEERTPDQRDAHNIAAWLRDRDITGTLDPFFQPVLDQREVKIAAIEGWILGIR